MQALAEKIEITAVAELSNDVAVVDAEVDIQTSDDARVVELGQDTDLALQQPACDFALDVAGPDLLDCDYLICVDVAAFEDLAEAAFAYFFCQVEHVVLDFLYCLPLLDLLDFHLRSLSINFNNQILYQICVATLPFKFTILILQPFSLSLSLSSHTQRKKLQRNITKIVSYFGCLKKKRKISIQMIDLPYRWK